jgi:YggT family protein
MQAILDVVLAILNLYQMVIIAVAIMSWLIAFDVVNTRNDVVRSIWNALTAITEPALRPIRKIVPYMGGLDISPVILYFVIYFLERFIQLYLYPAVAMRGI